jgi:hypothetical protein
MSLQAASVLPLSLMVAPASKPETRNRFLSGLHSSTFILHVAPFETRLVLSDILVYRAMEAKREGKAKAE